MRSVVLSSETPAGPEDTWPDVDAVRAAFDLPAGPARLVPVGGAWSNRVFRLDMGSDSFALKAIETHRDFLPPRWNEWLDLGYRFELQAISAGVRAPEPVPPVDSEGCLAWVERRDGQEQVPVRVHRWVEGSTCPWGPVAGSVAERAGRTLAVLHDLAVTPSDRDLFPDPGKGAAKRWASAVSSATETGMPWADDLVELGPVVERAVEMAGFGAERTRDEILCHGDVDQKNILVGPGGPVLCDWDYPTLWHPERELIDTAISLGAGQDFSVSRRVVASYEEGRGVKVHLRGSDLAPSLMVGLGWLIVNVRRATGMELVSPAQADLSRDLVPRLMPEYRRAVELIEKVEELLRT